MIERLREGPGNGCIVQSLDARDYPDTKIKLHFSHFKILVGPGTYLYLLEVYIHVGVLFSDNELTHFACAK